MNQAPSSPLQGPPRLVEQFLNWCLPAELKEPVVGDLSEEFIDRLTVGNFSQATLWYLRQALRTSLQFMWQTQRGLFMFLIGIILFIALMFMGMALGGGSIMYVDVPSMLMVFPPALVLGVGATSIQSFKTGLTLLISDKPDLEEKDYTGAAHSFSVIGNTAIWVGLAASIIGWVAMAVNIYADDFAKVFGPALAVSILTIMYAVVMKVLCYVAEQKVLFKMSQAA